MSKAFRIGSGAGFSGDRLEPAGVLVERGAIDFLALECLGERTIALAQLRRRRNAALGYDPLLERRMDRLLPLLKSHGVRLISNFGAANPLAAADAILAIARRQKLSIRVAVVTGDDVLSSIEPGMPTLESGTSIDACGELVSANAYLGVESLMPAIASGADIIITGRVADPSLFVAPMAHHFGWALDDYARLARATSVGHLLECAGQLCGGYFAEPGPKGGAAHGGAWISVRRRRRRTAKRRWARSTGTGGDISVANAKEQLLYEVTDPFGYVTPDVIADFSGVSLTQEGAESRARPRRQGEAAAAAAQGERRLPRRIRRRRRDRLFGIQRGGAGAACRRDHSRAPRGRVSAASHRADRQHLDARQVVRRIRAALRSALARGGAGADRRSAR